MGFLRKFFIHKVKIVLPSFIVIIISMMPFMPRSIRFSLILSIKRLGCICYFFGQVTGFSVGGRVVDSEGNGLMGVKIEIDDTERATTDSDGYYKLDQA